MNFTQPVSNEWEIKMLYDRYPDGCGKGCHCVHPADDCGCDDCEFRHACKTLRSKTFACYIVIRFN